MEGNTGLFSILALASFVSFAGILYPFKPFGKRWIALVSFLAFSVFAGVMAPKPQTVEVADPNPRPWAQPEGDNRQWVTSERLNRRTCPSESCGVVGQFFFREGVTIYETRDGWARVTEPYDASCASGRSEYVDFRAIRPANLRTESQTGNSRNGFRRNSCPKPVRLIRRRALLVLKPLWRVPTTSPAIGRLSRKRHNP